MITGEWGDSPWALIEGSGGAPQATDRGHSGTSARCKKMVLALVIFTPKRSAPASGSIRRLRDCASRHFASTRKPVTIKPVGLFTG